MHDTAKERANQKLVKFLRDRKEKVDMQKKIKVFVDAVKCIEHHLFESTVGIKERIERLKEFWPGEA